MNSFKKRQIIIISIFVVIAILIFLPIGSERCDGLFGFVDYSHSVKLGNSSFAIATDGTVEMATFEISGGKGFNGRGFGSAIFDSGLGLNLFFKTSGAQCQVFYEKGMKSPEERDSATSSYSAKLTLEDVEVAAEALIEKFAGQAMKVNFSSSSTASNSEVLLAGYDGYYCFDLSSGDLNALQAGSAYPVGDKLTVSVGDQVYMIVFGY